MNVLFTSVGRRVELLQAFRRAYQSLEVGGRIVALDIDPLAPALQVADQHYLVPRLSSSAYIPALLEICRRERISLVFPLIDPDLPVLAAHREAIERTGAKPAVLSVEATEITADKWLTTQFFRAIGLQTPRSWLPDQLGAAQFTYPIFIKPRCGSASQHTFKIRNKQELDFFVDYVPDPLVQEFIGGPEITSDVVCTPEGEVLAVVSRQRLEVRSGEVSKGVTVYYPDITQACLNIAQALPATGPITVQCMMQNGVPFFTEINARLGGGIPLGIAAGVDTPRWLLARAAGLHVELPPLGTYQCGLSMTRFDNSFFCNEEQRAQLASRHL